jgi:hypothetical protein
MDAFPPVGLADTPADGAAEVCVGARVDGVAGRLPDGPSAEPPSVEAPHAARTPTEATIHPAVHHSIPAPPGLLARIPDMSSSAAPAESVSAAYLQVSDLCRFVDRWVPSELYDPVWGRVRGGAQEPNPAGSVLDDGEDVQARPGQGAGLEEVAGEQGVGLAAEEVGPRSFTFG